MGDPKVMGAVVEIPLDPPLAEASPEVKAFVAAAKAWNRKHVDDKTVNYVVAHSEFARVHLRTDPMNEAEAAERASYAEVVTEAILRDAGLWDQAEDTGSADMRRRA